MRETAQAFAATWRKPETGEIVGTTWGGTMCWWPRRPWAMKFAGDGFEGIVRCGECPGCLEFDRRRLADRLQAKYGAKDEQVRAISGRARTQRPAVSADESSSLFVVRIWAPLVDQARLTRQLHRRRGLELEPGFFRLGSRSFAILSREVVHIRAILRSLKLEHRIEPVRMSRRRRAWRVITAGVLVAREVYGEQVKRWYSRGLPPAEKQSWEVDKHAMEMPWRRASGARAHRSGNVVLVPPEVWRLRPTERRLLRREYASATSPEGVERVMGLVAAALAGQTRQFNLTEPAAGRLTREQVQAWYQEMARKRKARTETGSAPGSYSPPSEGGGYLSSGHSSGADPPGESAIELLERQRRERQERERRKTDDAIRRFLEVGRKVAKKE